MSVATYDLIADLPIRIESLSLERLEHALSPEFTRVTTVIGLRGAGEEGVGEDVIYEAEEHDRLAGLRPGTARGGRVDAACRWRPTSTGSTCFPSHRTANPRATTAAGPSRAPPSTSRCARPG